EIFTCLEFRRVLFRSLAASAGFSPNSLYSGFNIAIFRGPRQLSPRGGSALWPISTVLRTAQTYELRTIKVRNKYLYRGNARCHEIGRASCRERVESTE